MSALKYCMRSEELGLVNTFACLHHLEPVWLLPVVLFSTDPTPPICVLFPQSLFHRETVTMRA